MDRSGVAAKVSARASRLLSPVILRHAFDLGGSERIEAVHEGDTDVDYSGLTFGVACGPNGRLGPGYTLSRQTGDLTYAQARGYEQADIERLGTRDRSRRGGVRLSPVKQIDVIPSTRPAVTRGHRNSINIAKNDFALLVAAEVKHGGAARTWNEISYAVAGWKVPPGLCRCLW